MKLVLLLLCFALALHGQLGNPPTVLWAVGVGGTNTAATLVKADSDGNIYVAGALTGQASFGTTNVMAINRGSPFLAKYSSQGNPLWVRILADSNAVVVTDICVSPNGLCFVALTTRLVSAIESFLIPTNAAACVLSYDAQGNPRWISRLQCNPYPDPVLTVDAGTNIYLTTTFRGSFSASGTNVSSIGSNGDAFLAAIDPTGAFRWVRQLSASEVVRPHGVGVDPSGNVYMAGHFLTNLNIVVTNLVARSEDNGYYDVFLVSYTPAGAFRWIAQAGSLRTDECWSLDVGKAGNVTITGQIESTANFPSRTVTPVSVGDMFVAQFRPDGTANWVAQAGMNQNGVRTVATTGPFGAIHVWARFQTNAQFGALVLTNGGATNCVLVQYDGAGNLRSVFQHSGPTAYDMCTDSAGNLICLMSSFTSLITPFTNNIRALIKFSATEMPLDISRNNDNVRVSWPQLANGFVLQTNSSANPSGWASIPTTNNTAAFLPTNPVMFYRLQRP
jgi:hypothetical protein